MLILQRAEMVGYSGVVQMSCCADASYRCNGMRRQMYTYVHTISAPSIVPVTNEQMILFLQMHGVTPVVIAPRMNAMTTAWVGISIKELRSEVCSALVKQWKQCSNLIRME